MEPRMQIKFHFHFSFEFSKGRTVILDSCSFMMEPIREITEEFQSTFESGSDYTNVESGPEMDSIQRLRQEMRAEMIARQFRSCSCYKCLKILLSVVIISLIWFGMGIPSALYIKSVVSYIKSLLSTEVSGKLYIG